MKLLATIGVAVTVAASASTVSADELVSGPQVGEKVTSLLFEFGGEKCGGVKDRYPVGRTETNENTSRRPSDRDHL